LTLFGTINFTWWLWIELTGFGKIIDYFTFTRLELENIRLLKKEEEREFARRESEQQEKEVREQKRERRRKMKKEQQQQWQQQHQQQDEQQWEQLMQQQREQRRQRQRQYEQEWAQWEQRQQQQRQQQQRQQPQTQQRPIERRNDKYYRVLGLSRQATPKQVKKAYTRLALKWHPDHNRSPEAESMIKTIIDAYKHIYKSSE
jgi:hypothetical protein